MFNSAVKGTGWTIIKIILAIITFSLFIYQMIFAGKWLVSNQHEGRRIGSSDYESLITGETVYGKFENIVADCGIGEDGYGNEMKYYLAKTDSGKLLVFRTERESMCDKAMASVLSGNTKGIYFIGYVKPLMQKDSSVLSLTMLADNTLDNLNIEGELSEAVLSQVVDVSIYKEYSDERVFIASIVGGLLMLGLTILLLRKIVKNMVYSIGVMRGKIKPYMPEIDYVQHKKEFEQMERIDPENAEDLEYYNDYEKDSIDFTQEKKYKTIYGEEYEKPTLEKDIATYGGYEYDSLDFAQKPPEKKDINQF